MHRFHTLSELTRHYAEVRTRLMTGSAPKAPLPLPVQTRIERSFPPPVFIPLLYKEVPLMPAAWGVRLINVIQRRVCDAWHIGMHDLVSPRRLRRVTVPRQFAMALCRQITTRSLPEIGMRFGGKDHTTVMHACKKLKALMDEGALALGPVASVDSWVEYGLQRLGVPK